jgi:hypothetical protein
VSSNFGGLLRNAFGGWITCFVERCGFTSNTNAELQVICRGLDILLGIIVLEMRFVSRILKRL